MFYVWVNIVCVRFLAAAHSAACIQVADKKKVQFLVSGRITSDPHISIYLLFLFLAVKRKHYQQIFLKNFLKKHHRTDFKPTFDQKLETFFFSFYYLLSPIPNTYPISPPPQKKKKLINR